MNHMSKINEMINLDPPAELNRRILAAASLHAKHNAFRKRIWGRALWTAAAAAAVVVTACGVWFYTPETEAPVDRGSLDRNELNALADWTQVEQESYNLSISMNSGLEAVQEM